MLSQDVNNVKSDINPNNMAYKKTSNPGSEY